METEATAKTEPVPLMEIGVEVKGSGQFRIFPNYDGDEVGQVRARVDGRLFCADWCHQDGMIRVLTANGLAQSEPRDPAKGSLEVQARAVMLALLERVFARARTTKAYPPGPDGRLNPARLP